MHWLARYSSTTVNVTLMWNWNLPVFVGLLQLLDQILTGWNKHDTVNSWCRQSTGCWAGWLSPNVIACSGFEESAWAWNKRLAALSQTDLLQCWLFARLFWGVPAVSSVLETWSNIPWPDWTRCSYWLYLFPAVFISFQSTNGSLWHCLVFPCEIFHCAD